MADISAWDPVDESNTASPPNGWPENMAVSGVNNSARAMMGAVRRFYDKLYDGSFVFSSITCIGNASVAGTLTAGEVDSLAVVANSITGNALTCNGNMIVAGTLTAGEVDSTTVVAGLITGTTINALGAITGASVGSSGAIFATGAITGGTVNSNNNISAAGTLTAGIANVTNTLTADHVTTNGGDVFGTLNAYTVAVSGTASANLLTANSINSNSSVNATRYDLRGVQFALMDAGATYTQISDPGIVNNITMYAIGDNYYFNNTHSFGSRGGLSSYAVFQSTGTYNQSGSWAVISDDRLKRDVAPYTAGLDALLRLTPRSFEYTDAAPWPGRSYGLMASEVAGVVPEMVGEAEFDGVPVQTVQPTHAVYLLINACKELAARVATLEGALTHEQR